MRTGEEANCEAAKIRLCVLRAFVAIKGKAEPTCVLTLADRIADDFELRYFAPFDRQDYTKELHELRDALRKFDKCALQHNP